LNPPPDRAAPLAEAAGIIAICFGWFILLSIHAVASGFPGGDGFSDAEFAGLIAIELVLASVALTVLHIRKYRLHELLPAPTWMGCGIGLLLYAGSLFASGMLTAPFAAGQPAQPIEDMVSNNSVTLPYVLALGIVNGTYEEVFLLGHLLRGLKSHGASFAIGASLLVRVLYHLYQGPIGALSVLGFGLVISVHYLRTGRLWPAVFAHMLGDIVPFI
jgi:membrane protease YdiL (CAAX protease family)